MNPKGRRLVFLIDTNKIPNGQTLGQFLGGRLSQWLVDASADGTPPEAKRRQPSGDDLAALGRIGLHVDEAGELGIKSWDLLWAALAAEIHQNHEAGRQLSIRDAAYLLCENTGGSLWDDYSEIVDMLENHAFDRGEPLLLGPDPGNTTLGAQRDLIYLLEFNAELAYLAIAPNGDACRDDWEFLRRIDSTNREAIESLTFHDLYQY